MKKGLKQRDWNEIKTNDSWSIFKIMGEFVQGFETLQRIGPCVSIYGSARMAEDSTVYNQSREVARQLSALVVLVRVKVVLEYQTARFREVKYKC